MSNPEATATKTPRALSLLARLSGASTYTDYRRRCVDESSTLLRKVLTDIGLQNKLAAEYPAASRDFPVGSPYPSWARHLAYVLRDPEGRFSAETRRSLFEVSHSMLEELDTDESGRLVTQAVLRADLQTPVLTAIARDLVLNPPRHRRLSC
jgi:hypothetical protein